MQPGSPGRQPGRGADPSSLPFGPGVGVGTGVGVGDAEDAAGANPQLIARVGMRAEITSKTSSDA